VKSGTTGPRRKRPTRTTKVFVPELGLKVTVRAPTDGELKGTGEDLSTPEAVARVTKRIISAAVVSPKLTAAQIESLSDESIERICGARLLLHPVTAALRARVRRTS
jgi:hypothetical protein